MRFKRTKPIQLFLSTKIILIRTFNINEIGLAQTLGIDFLNPRPFSEDLNSRWSRDKISNILIYPFFFDAIAIPDLKYMLTFNRGSDSLPK